MKKYVQFTQKKYEKHRYKNFAVTNDFLRIFWFQNLEREIFGKISGKISGKKNGKISYQTA